MRRIKLRNTEDINVAVAERVIVRVAGVTLYHHDISLVLRVSRTVVLAKFLNRQRL